MIIAETWMKDAFGRTVHTKRYIKIPDPNYIVTTGWYTGWEQLWRFRLYQSGVVK